MKSGRSTKRNADEDISQVKSKKSKEIQFIVHKYDWCSQYPGSLVDLSSSNLTDSTNFKIVSWNINGLKAWLKKGGSHYISVEDPDVVCFQEVKCTEDKLPGIKFLETYLSHWNSAENPGYAGTGISSKLKPISICNGINVEEHDKEGRVLTAEFELFFLVTAYVPNSGRGLLRLDYRTKEWDIAFCDYIKKLDAKKPVILCGDLNVAHCEIDLANPAQNKKTAGFTDQERQGFTNFLKETDLVDSYRYLYPDRKIFTFWSAMRNSFASNTGWRLDYFLVSRRFLSHVVDQEIRCAVGGSDHCPVVLYLKI